MVPNSALEGDVEEAGNSPRGSGFPVLLPALRMWDVPMVAGLGTHQAREPKRGVGTGQAPEELVPSPKWSVILKSITEEGTF